MRKKATAPPKAKTKRVNHQAVVNELLRFVGVAPERQVRTLQASARAVLERVVLVTENGVTKKVPLLDAILMRYLASDDPRKHKFLLRLENDNAPFGKQDLHLEKLARIKAGKYMGPVDELRKLFSEIDDEREAQRGRS